MWLPIRHCTAPRLVHLPTTGPRQGHHRQAHSPWQTAHLVLLRQLPRLQLVALQLQQQQLLGGDVRRQLPHLLLQQRLRRLKLFLLRQRGRLQVSLLTLSSGLLRQGLLQRGSGLRVLRGARRSQ
jgi:hypothetical protein